jgi:hypothetical protein
MHEDLDITNNSMRPVRFQLEISLRSDFVSRSIEQHRAPRQDRHRNGQPQTSV